MFPGGAAPMAPLRAAAEGLGSGDFSPLWSGEGAALAPRGLDAGDLTRRLAAQAAALARGQSGA
jgi:nitronate monooxygenase